YRREHDHHGHAQGDEHTGTIRAADHDQAPDTVLLVGTLTFAGACWRTTGDALLANTAAAMARARQTTAREEIAHQIGTTPTAAPLAA
ncbi:MAG TPA: plasmid replication initiator protein, partial [Micromonosporaceae bacterium]|nr:plasmid replication initiator protein [Micromonosporaceae bacterium]